MMYNPEEWELVKIGGTDPHYRVFGSWRGGYLNGDSWRMNSGIKECVEDGDYYIFKGYSGSEYQCHKETYGIRSPWNASVLDDYCERASGHMTRVESMPDNLTMFDWIATKGIDDE